MTSHARRESAGIAPVNVKTIEFSITAQSVVNGETPARVDASPSCVGVPPNTASMCGTLPGSVSVNVMLNGANTSRMQLTVAFQVAALTFQARSRPAG